MSTRASTQQLGPLSATAPSPFGPIADYAFLSNCHTGALIEAAAIVVPDTRAEY